MKKPPLRCKVCNRKIKNKLGLFCEKCLSRKDKTFDVRIRVAIELNKKRVTK